MKQDKSIAIRGYDHEGNEIRVVKSIAANDWVNRWWNEIKDEAADICQVCASAAEYSLWGDLTKRDTPAVLTAAKEMGARLDAAALALATVKHVQRRARILWVAGLWNTAEFYAEAESMLRADKALPGRDWHDFAEACWRVIKADDQEYADSISIADIAAGVLDAPVTTMEAV